VFRLAASTTALLLALGGLASCGKDPGSGGGDATPTALDASGGNGADGSLNAADASVGEGSDAAAAGDTGPSPATDAGEGCSGGAQACSAATPCPAPANDCQAANCDQGCCTTVNKDKSAACSAGVCDGEGRCGCAADGDCPVPADECTAATCTAAGACSTRPRGQEHSLSTGQTPGDCQELVCDGAGGTISVDDPFDLPVPATVCQTATCYDSPRRPGFKPVAKGTDCTADGTPGAVVCGDPENPALSGRCVACNLGDTQCSNGGPRACDPATGKWLDVDVCARLGANCGPLGDGCGSTVDCGACTPPESCGAGGVPSVCGVPSCMPKTCAELGLDCGVATDGCGSPLDCGSCAAPQVCGASTPNVCAIPITCTNLCLKQVSCGTPAATTSVSGVVYAPNGVDPLPNVTVYVPNAPVQPFTPGVSCSRCNDPLAGSPLVRATTDAAGAFKLTNMPVGAAIPLVIETGRWRRQITLPTVAACVDTPLAAAQTRLPKNKSEGDLPLMAFVTGGVDTLECGLRKIGIDDSEFTAPTGTGRVHLWTGSGYGGATSGGTGAPLEDGLWSTQATLNQYDVVFFACQGSEYLKPATAQQNLINYANAGGRVLATHYSYVWLFNAAPFSSTAVWAPDIGFPMDQTASVEMSFPKGQLLAQWLQIVGASTILGQIPLGSLRNDFTAVNAPSQVWLSVQSPPAPVHYSFGTPVGVPASQQCGRVQFTDYHVEEGYADPRMAFPSECPGGAMTPMEKLLEFTVFDLTGCVSADGASCTPRTCAEQAVQCGPAGDGCGNLLQCGDCPSGQTCGGSGLPSVCGAPSCTPRTCAEQALQCGPAGDGCGNLIQCGDCPTGQNCGGGGQAGVCGPSACVPKNCVELGIQCGPAGDGCGNLIMCGMCPAGQTCGGGGQAAVCGALSCTPVTCALVGADCGPIGDGCGNVLQCGTCPPPQTCGGGGAASVCG
jgi:hypothetical protein